MSLKFRLALVVLCAATASCGTSGDGLTFDFSLVAGFDSSLPANETTRVLGLITVTNHTSESVSFTVPNIVGYRARDTQGNIVNSAPASYTSCVTCGAPLVAQIASGQSFVFTSASLQWQLTAPNNPADIGNPDAPSHVLTPGRYDVSILVGGDGINVGRETTSASITVCDNTSGPFAVCNHPCATVDAAAAAGIGPVDCGDTLSCASF